MAMEFTAMCMKPLRLCDIAFGSVGDNYHKVGWTVGSDAAEAGTTTTVINATGHAAAVGDIIIMTSGGEDGEARSVDSITANTITLTTALSGAPSATETFDILRPVSSKHVKVLHIENGLDRRVFFSTDASTDHITVANGSSLTLDLKTNNLRLGANNTIIKQGSGTDPNQYLYVKTDGTAPTSGTLYISMIQ